MFSMSVLLDCDAVDGAQAAGSVMIFTRRVQLVQGDALLRALAPSDLLSARIRRVRSQRLRVLFCNRTRSR